MILLIVNSVISPLGGFYVSNTFEVGGGDLEETGGLTWEEGAYLI